MLHEVIHYLVHLLIRFFTVSVNIKKVLNATHHIQDTSHQMFWLQWHFI